MTHSPLTNGFQITSDSDVRTQRIDHFIVHHAATTSLAAILSLFQPGGRTVSANYALGSDGTLIMAVDEDRRAWTSSSSAWDGRSVTIEVANSVAGDPWPVSDAAFDKLARLIGDVARRYGFAVNDTNVLTHQELYNRYGASYATSCPGDLQRRKGELLGKAAYYATFGSTAGGGSTPIENGDTDMTMERFIQPGSGMLFFNDEMGVDAVSSFVDKGMTNAEVVDSTNRAWGKYTDPFDGNRRLFDVAAAIGERRWEAKRAEIVADVVAALKPIIEEALKPQVP